MARKMHLFRSLAIARDLANGVDERTIIRDRSKEWKLTRSAVRIMLKKFLHFVWTQEHPAKTVYTSLSPWKTSPLARERMNLLRDALASGQARASIVQEWAHRWGVTEQWVSALLTRVLAESQHEIHEQAQEELARYVARLRAHLAKHAELRNHPLTNAAYERLTLLTKA